MSSEKVNGRQTRRSETRNEKTRGDKQVSICEKGSQQELRSTDKDKKSTNALKFKKKKIFILREENMKNKPEQTEIHETQNVNRCSHKRNEISHRERKIKNENSLRSKK